MVGRAADRQVEGRDGPDRCSDTTVSGSRVIHDNSRSKRRKEGSTRGSDLLLLAKEENNSRKNRVLIMLDPPIHPTHTFISKA
jgi:hypothetical protein